MIDIQVKISTLFSIQFVNDIDTDLVIKLVVRSIVVSSYVSLEFPQLRRGPVSYDLSLLSSWNNNL